MNREDSHETAIVPWSEVISPLCAATQRILTPLRLSPTDRLRLTLDAQARHFLLEPYSNAIEGQRTLASFAARDPFFARFPEREFATSGLSPFGGCKVGATDFSVLVIGSSWPREQLEFSDDDTLQVFNYLKLRFARQTILARQRAEFKESGTLPAPPAGYVEHPDYPLNPYQKAALFTCIGEEGSALFMEQGTGKTPIVIARVCYEAMKCHRMYRALVVCPKNARMNWQNEVIKFSTLQGKIAVLRGGLVNRVKMLAEALKAEPGCKFTVVVVSYDIMRRNFELLKSPWREELGSWDLLVLDESHFIKGSYSKRSGSAVSFRDFAKSRMVLTGTPVCNGVHDLWAQLEFLYEGGSGFLDQKKFREYYLKFAEKRRSRFARVVIGTQNLPVLKERLARVSFITTKREALPYLPEKTYDAYEVEMTPEQRDAYEQLALHLVAEIEQDLKNSDASSRHITVNNILVKLLRLAQVTSGFVAFDQEYTDTGGRIDMERIKFFRPNPKAEALIDILSQRQPEDKFIVWATFVPDILEISARLLDEGIGHVTYYGATDERMREKAVWAFNNDPTCAVFVGNPSAGGTAINLWGYNPEKPEMTTNCSRVVYYSQNWSMPVRAQSEDRCHRIGTRTSVQYTDLVVPGTIDEEIRARVLGKKMRALEAQDLREVLAQVLKIPTNGD